MLLGLLGLAGLLVVGDEAAAQGGPPAVTVARPLVRQIVEDDEFIGRFEPVDQVAVRARVGGYLDRVHFTDGTLVDKGELLFTIDPRPFELALSVAQAALTTAQAQTDFALQELDRGESLSGAGNLSASNLENRRRAYLSAQAELDGAEAAVGQAQLDLEYTRILAPLSGRIDRRLVSEGSLVQADQTVLTTIVSLDPIDFYFDIDERAFLAYARDAQERGGALQQGAGGLAVTVRLDDDRIPPVSGVLDFAENRIDAQTGTLRARARFANPDLLLTPGLFGRINVPGSLPYQGVLVPDEAVVADQDRRIVYTVDAAGLVAAVPVRPGPMLYGYRVIRDGLTGEETVIVNGLMRVRPGVTVIPELVELPPERAGIEAVGLGAAP